MALPPDAARPTPRLLLGTASMVVAWVGLMVRRMVAPSVELTVLGGGTFAAVLAEHRGLRRLSTPWRMPWLHWGVSVVALVMMTMVLILRGIGQTIVF